MQYIPLVWYVAFEDLKPSGLNNRIVLAGSFVYNDAAYVGCSVGIFKVLGELNKKLMTPRRTGPVEVQGTVSGSLHCGQRSVVSRQSQTKRQQATANHTT